MCYLFFIILAETDWIAEFAKKQELAEKANKLKVINQRHFCRYVVLVMVLENWFCQCLDAVIGAHLACKMYYCSDEKLSCMCVRVFLITV